MDVPVLLLVHARPEHVRAVVEALRGVRCATLYVGADGPRSDVAGEAARCLEARAAATAIDWPCRVATRFLDHNQGCAAAVSGALSWFFESNERGIVLEEDCVPHPTFFRFCEALLDRYANHPQVGAITGNNFQRGLRRGPASYYFSRYPHCWGWATWRRGWRLYDHAACARWTRSSWQALPQTRMSERAYWSCIRSMTNAGLQDSWANRWTHSLWRRGLLTATPQNNLVDNIGIGAESTHTRAAYLLPSPATPIGFPLVHPDEVACHASADRLVATDHFRVRRWPLLWASSTVRMCGRAVSR